MVANRNGNITEAVSARLQLFDPVSDTSMTTVDDWTNSNLADCPQNPILSSMSSPDFTTVKCMSRGKASYQWLQTHNGL